MSLSVKTFLFFLELTELIIMQNPAQTPAIPSHYNDYTIMQNPTQTPTIPSHSHEYTIMQNRTQTPAIPSHSNEYTHWSRNVTLRLIDEYKKNHKNVGSKIRSFKILYENIATILNAEFGLKLSGPQVNNKFQTLVRSYKSVVDNNKKKLGEEEKVLNLRSKWKKYSKNPNELTQIYY